MALSPVQSIGAIYKSVRYRSQTEARWAVFFDELSVSAIHEHNGMRHREAGRYLPDFLLNLPFAVMWFEVKPFLFHGKRAIGNLQSEVERTLKIMRDLSRAPINGLDSGPYPCLIIGGTPRPGATGLLFWPREKEPWEGFASLGVCEFCDRLCLLAEDKNNPGIYGLRCPGCLGDMMKKRYIAAHARALMNHPRIIRAAHVACSMRFDATEAPTPAKPRPRQIVGGKGISNHASKLDDDNVRAMRALRRRGHPIGAIARRFQVCSSTAYRAITGATWRHVL
jgi:hypothetical protein